MNCYQVAINIVKQLVVWIIGIISWFLQQCWTVTQLLWQAIQQWQNRCTQETSRVCRSLPWPISAFCTWVTNIVCTLVSIVIFIAIIITLVICTLITVWAIEILSIVLIIITTLLITLCFFIPCYTAVESSVPPDNGWLVTLGEANPPSLTQTNAVQFLVDGESACQFMIEAIEKATQTIHLLQLEFEKDFTATFPGFTRTCPPQPPFEGPNQNTELTQALLDAATKRGIHVRILVNEGIAGNSLPALQTVFAGKKNIEVAGLKPPHKAEVMHAKALIVDESIAVIAGLPFNQGYWDTQLHCVTDQRRGSGAGTFFPPLGDVGNGVGKKPAHTVSLGLGGPAAADVDGTFISLWNSVSTDTIAPPIPKPGFGNQSIQIVRTSPALNASGLSKGEKGALESYLRAINNAQRFLYMEAQYFTSPVINAALNRALKAKSNLQLILLLNENPDIPTYKFWQNPLISQLAATFPGQVGTFTLWRTQPPNEDHRKPQIVQCYMEAKVSLVDDAWAAIGSANLDGPSLGHIFEFLPSPLSCISAFEGWRNVEINTVLYDGIAQQTPTHEVSRLRTLLWKEHLGLEEIPQEPPAGGWLALWLQIAHQNITSLNTTQAMSGNLASPSRILPYSPALNPVGQLSQLGINTNLFDVAPAVPQ